jgi:hypothetical protein
MIVVTANWEIGDGSLWPGLAAGIMARFRAEVARAALRAGWQNDGRYEPVPRVDVVFAGDTFDWLASREWLGSSRPWQATAKARAIHERVVVGTLRAGRGVIRGMLALARRGIDVSRADRHGRPIPGALVRVPVGLSILEGNLDAGLGREAARMPAERTGIAVGAAWEARGIRVTHGDGTDPIWMVDRVSPSGGGPSLGEILRVDLLARFATSPAIAAIDPDARRRFLAALRGAHPLALGDTVAAWCVANRDPAMAGVMRDEWLRSVAAWHRAARGSGLSAAGTWSEASFDVVDALAGRLSTLDRLASAGRPPTGTVDHLADLLGASPPIATVGAGCGCLVLGHAAIDASSPLGTNRVIGLGARSGVDRDRDGVLPGVREIALHPSTPRFPVTALFTDRGEGPMAVSSLGDPVAEWAETGRQRGWSPRRADAGAWVVEAA